MYIITIEEVLPSNHPGSAMHPNIPGGPEALADGKSAVQFGAS